VCVCVCVCVCVALLIQHAMRKRCIILPPVACPTRLCFSTLSHKRHDFREKKVIEHKIVFLLSLNLLPDTFIILRKKKLSAITS